MVCSPPLGVKDCRATCPGDDYSSLPRLLMMEVEVKHKDEAIFTYSVVAVPPLQGS